MEITIIGKVVVPAHIENLQDLYDADRGISKERIFAELIFPKPWLIQAQHSFNCREKWFSN